MGKNKCYCGAELIQLHNKGCNLEQCPCCNGPIISCGCVSIRHQGWLKFRDKSSPGGTFSNGEDNYLYFWPPDNQRIPFGGSLKELHNSYNCELVQSRFNVDIKIHIHEENISLIKFLNQLEEDRFFKDVDLHSFGYQVYTKDRESVIKINYWTPLPPEKEMHYFLYKLLQSPEDGLAFEYINYDRRYTAEKIVYHRNKIYYYEPNEQFFIDYENNKFQGNEPPLRPGLYYYLTYTEDID